MKKTIIISFVVIAIGITVYFLVGRDSSEKMVKSPMPKDTITQKVLAPGEKIDYKIDKNNKVVKAIVADPKHSKEKIIGRIMDLVPFDNQSSMIMRMLEQLRDNPAITAETYQKLEAVVNKHFSQSILREKMGKALQEKMTREELAEVLAWQETPVAGQINEIAARSIDPDYTQDMAEDLQNFNIDEVSENRQKLLKQLDEATGGTETAIENMVLVQTSMMTAMTAKRGMPMGEDQLKEMEEGMRESLRDNLAPQAFKASAMLYRDLSDDMLESAVNANQSAANQKQLQVLREVNSEILKSFGHDFGGELSHLQ